MEMMEEDGPLSSSEAPRDGVLPQQIFYFLFFFTKNDLI